MNWTSWIIYLYQLPQKKNRYIWSQICIEDELDILSLCHIPLSSTSKKIDIWLQFLH